MKRRAKVVDVAPKILKTSTCVEEDDSLISNSVVRINVLTFLHNDDLFRMGTICRQLYFETEKRRTQWFEWQGVYAGWKAEASPRDRFLDTMIRKFAEYESHIDRYRHKEMDERLGMKLMENGLPDRLNKEQHQCCPITRRFHPAYIPGILHNVLRGYSTHCNAKERVKDPRWRQVFHVYADVMNFQQELFEVASAQTSQKGALAYAARRNPFLFPAFVKRANGCTVEVLAKYMKEFLDLKSRSYGYRRYHPKVSRKRAIYNFLTRLSWRGRTDKLEKWTHDLSIRFPEDLLAPSMFTEYILSLPASSICIMLWNAHRYDMEEKKFLTCLERFLRHKNCREAAVAFFKKRFLDSGECGCKLVKQFLLASKDMDGCFELIRSCKADSHTVY